MKALKEETHIFAGVTGLSSIYPIRRVLSLEAVFAILKVAGVFLSNVAVCAVLRLPRVLPPSNTLGNMRASNKRMLGRQAQIMPTLNSMSDHTLTKYPS